MKAKEAAHLLISVVTIALAFTIGSDDVPSAFAANLLAVGAAFLFHELGHRTVAKYYGKRAEYEAYTLGLAFAVLLALATNGALIFAAPGAVVIYGAVTKEENGKIAFAGPAANMAMALLFFLMAGAGIIPGMAFFAAKVNAFIGLFNLIPVEPFDGKKIREWNDGIWGATTIILLVMLLLMVFF